MEWGYYDICVDENIAFCGSGQDQSRIAPDLCKYQPMTTARVSGTPEAMVTSAEQLLLRPCYVEQWKQTT